MEKFDDASLLLKCLVFFLSIRLSAKYTFEDCANQRLNEK